MSFKTYSQQMIQKLGSVQIAVMIQENATKKAFGKGFALP